MLKIVENEAVREEGYTLDALARSVPDMQADALLRHQLADIRHAANATQLVHGRLWHDTQGFNLELSLDEPAAADAAHKLRVQGTDATALFVAYTAAAPAWLGSARIPTGDPPALPTPALVAYGRGLLASSRRQPDTAAQVLAQIPADPPSALVALATLDAQAAARQQLPLQTTRELVLKTFVNDPRPEARQAYARALAGNDQGQVAMRVLAGAMGKFPHDVQLAMLDAETLSDNGDDRHAIDVLKPLVKADDQDARAWFLLGRSAIKQGDAQAAVDDYLVHALVLNTRAGNDVAAAETSNAIGVGYERLGQLAAAAEQYAHAAAMRQKLDDKEGLAKSLRNLAVVQAERGDRTAAEHALDRVKTLLEGLGDHASLADLYNDRGVVAEERGDFADALSNYRQALAIRQQLDTPDLIAESLNNVGYCAYHMGDFDNAGVYWQQALAQFQRLDNHNGALHVTQNMGLLDIARGRFGAARERLEASLRTAEDHQLPEEAAVAQVSLADLALIEGRFTDAAAAADRAEQIFVRRSDQRGQNEARLQHARIALAAADVMGVDKALGGISVDRLSTEQRAAYLLVTARRAALVKDYSEAITKLDAAAAAASAAHSGTLAMSIQLERTRLTLAKGDLSSARKQLATLRKQTTQLGEVPLRLGWLELELAVAVRGKDNTQASTRYREALALLKSSGRYGDGVLIYKLGERAVRSNSAEASAAHAAAVAAHTQLLADTPAAARESLQQWLRRRWQEESGSSDGT